MVDNLAPEAGAGPADVSRRTVLKRGALVGVAAVWTVPAVQALSLGAAHATQPSGHIRPPRGGQEEPLPTPPTGLCSYAFFLLQCGGRHYCYQISSSGQITSAADTAGLPYLDKIGYASVVTRDKGIDTTWSQLAASITAGVTTLMGKPVYFLSGWPTSGALSASLIGAFMADESFSRRSEGRDTFRPAIAYKGIYYFYK